jgi:succinate dehydrogenase / fumarate reductase cytochrome b subunit
MKAYKPKRHYRWHAGFVAWLLHRLSGLALAAF